MFGSNREPSATAAKAAPTKPNAAATAAGMNALLNGTQVIGKIFAENDIRIDGTVKGDVFCNARVVIGPTGVIEGSITCQNARIEGKFDGTLVVKEMLDLRASAQVSGDITTDKLTVEAGAIFNVTCKMGTGTVGAEPAKAPVK